MSRPRRRAVAGERLLRILTELRAGSQAGPGPGTGGQAGSETRRLCEVATGLTSVSGAGIMLVSEDVPQGSLAATDAVAELIESLQHTLGEGPCVDAHHSGRAVAEPDLASPDVTRWQAFGPPAVAGGARAVFGFPVRVGVARLGALDLYRDRPGPLSDEQHADALVLAYVAARAILSMQADAPPGTVATELAAEANFHFVVHQAAGMLSAHLGIGIGEALVRLRAHAFRTDRLVGEVAQDVVDRHLHFDHLGDETG